MSLINDLNLLFSISKKSIGKKWLMHEPGRSSDVACTIFCFEKI